jgi:hypothetical protein
MNALVELALAISEKEKVSEDVSDVVKTALEKHRQEREEAASNDIVALLRQIETHKLEQRRNIRKLKSELNCTVKALDDLDRRWAYAQATNNFLPVLAFFHSVSPNDLVNSEDFDLLTTVPADFKVSA